jgi:hypothetical protein
MNRSRLYALALAALVAAQTPHAQERGTGATGIAFVSGGVGQSEQGLLYEERLRYTLWLTTAAKGSGAYLAGARALITDLDTRKPVLAHTLQGPWLMAALPAGRYAVEVQFRATPASEPQSVRTQVRIGDRGLRRRVLYFAAADQVDSAREPSFESRPDKPLGMPRQAHDR